MVQGSNMDVMPIPNEAALILDDGILVVADLHIGMERELKEAGFILPSQTDKMTDRLLHILEDAKAHRLIVLGDFKHNVPQTSRQEWDEIPMLVEAAREHVEAVEILPGNHDGGIRKVLPEDVKVWSSRGTVIGDIGLFHGHAWPSQEVMESKTVIVAHEHPVVLFKDKLGMRIYKRCWVRSSFRKRSDRFERMPKELIVMPTFNEFCGGTPVNDPESDFLGPILSDEYVALGKSQIHLLDGTFLGMRSDLMLK